MGRSKERELWLNKIWSEAGLTPLIEFYEDIDKNKSIRVKAADDKLKTEYTPKNSNTIYNSALLRVALMNYSSNPE
jgi:hypothetical protein